MRNQGQVLNTRVEVIDYQGAIRLIEEWANDAPARLVAAANTHLIAEAQANAAFASVLDAFDLIVPDGMPLVWALRLDGWDLRDRVYGPYLMEKCLAHRSARCRHFFLGSSEGCLEQLVRAAKKLNPEIHIADVFSPPFGTWTDETNAEIAMRIDASGANVVWVALGGVRQETWLVENRHRYQSGVFLAVGDAFALVAGLRPYTPEWMQRAGLTWLYRLVQEPRRLGGRYLRYNCLFLIDFLVERWTKAHGANCRTRNEQESKRIE